MAKTLVAYFSHAGENYDVGVIEKGNTELLAQMIVEELNADTFRIETVEKYSDDYEECKAAARHEQSINARPKLAALPQNLDYDVIFLGYPIWYDDMPMAVYTFLESLDFTGKTLVPFCTHAGSGASGTVRSIKKCCPAASVTDPLVLTGAIAQNHPARAKNEVESFIKQHGL